MTFSPTHLTHLTRRAKSSFGETLGRPEKNQKTLITLSGGQDSSLVGWVLFNTQNYYSARPRSLHYQHLLQPDTLDTKKHCAQLSFWFNWESLYSLATRYYPNEKEAGDWRRVSSSRIAPYYNCPFLLKGQSLTDQYETTATLLLRTLMTTSEEDGQTQEDLFQTEDTPMWYNSALFARQKKQSCWFPGPSERKVGGRVKFYRGIKHGT
jgi:tRNA(Ile)-lysidine synthase TilS/MesJ